MYGDGAIYVQVFQIKEKMIDMNLNDADIGVTYTVKEIVTDDDELGSFLFRLGCYSGEPVTIISRNRKGNMVLLIKDGRYNVDSNIAEAIHIETEA